MTATDQTPKIFLVDDNRYYVKLLEKQLNNMGFTNTYIFNSGEQCLENLFQYPDIILLDHNMDEMDGLEVLRKIKSYDPNIHVIFLSGQDKMDVALNALKYGAFDYVIKGDGDAEKIKTLIPKLTSVEKEIVSVQNKSRAQGFYVLMVFLLLSAYIIGDMVINHIST
jgi:CheY-like chemotaxis protein